MKEQCFSIVASAISVPGRRVESVEIDRELGLDEGSTEKDTGVATRYWASEETSVVDLAVSAARKAMEAGGVKPGDLDLIINAGATPQQLLPCNAVLIHDELGAPSRTACFDLDQACLGFLPALDIAAHFLSSGYKNTVLIVCAETPSKFTNPTSREAYRLLGDGAAAVILSNTPTTRLLATELWTLSGFKDFCKIVGGGMKLAGYEHNADVHQKYFFDMDGPALFKGTWRSFPDMIRAFLDKNGLSVDDIDMYVPHQAALTAMRLLQRNLKVSSERRLEIVQRFGNCGSASIPMTLHLAREENRISSADKILLLGTGAGITLGASLLVM